MMYKEKFAAAIKADGKVLREFDDIVYIPFGTEYSIFMKNLNTVRALVSITVDGEDIADGSSFVIGANSSVDIERFLRNGNNEEGNRFKFIERTSSVEEYRGIGVEDGLVRIEYQFEKPIRYETLSNRKYGAFSNDYEKLCWPQATSVSYTTANEAGITVEGSISNQKFKTVSDFPVDPQKHAMVIRLFGETEKTPVKRPVTVKTKPTCKTCGTKGKATNKFCSNCGTSLQIVA